VDEHNDPLESALLPLRSPAQPHTWASTEEVKRRATARRRRRLAALSGGTTVLLATVLVVALVSAGGGRGPVLPSDSGAIQRLAGPVGSYQLVADVKLNEMLGTRDTQAEVALAEQSFALRLTQLELAGSSGGNVLLSPMSAHVDLSMLELGTAGATAHEVAAALQSSGLSPAGQAAAWNGLVQRLLAGESAGELHLANSIWLRQGLFVEPRFLRREAETFGNDTYQVNFDASSAEQAINAWVSQQTAGRIKELYAPHQLSTFTEVVLANALHFHAAWQKGLLAEAAIDNEPFYLASGGSVSVPMIVDSGAVLPVEETSTYDAVQLPYTNGRYAALLLEPTQGSVASLLAELTAGRLASITGALRSDVVNFAMPKLALSVNHSLEAPLSAMGMAETFYSADFSPMLGAVGAVNQAVGGVQQAATLDVNQWGTDAAAATGVSVIPTLARQSTTIAFNHPYVFLLRDTKTGVILFSSVVNNPANA